MAQKHIINIKGKNKDWLQVVSEKGAPAQRIRLGEPSTLDLVDAGTGMAPTEVQAVRQGSALNVSLGGNSTGTPDLVIENFFEQEGSSLIGQAEPGEYYDYIASEAAADGASALTQMSDARNSVLTFGQSTSPAVFGSASGLAAAGAAVSAVPAVPAVPMGTYVLGGLALAAPKSSSSTSAPVPSAAGISTFAADNVANAAESASSTLAPAPAPSAADIGTVAADNVLNAAESASSTPAPVPVPSAAGISTFADDNIVNATEAAGALVISGTKEAGASVVLSIPGVSVSGTASTATIAADSSTAWTYTLSAGALNAVADNAPYTISATQTNAAGGVSAPVTQSFLVDRTAPTVPTFVLASDTGASPSDGITSNATVNVGSIESGATWQYQVDGGAWSNGSGSSFTITATDGLSHAYVVRQIDAAGNITASASKAFQLLSGSTPSVLTVALQSDTGASSTDGITNNSTVSVTGVATGSSWQYQVDGGAWNNGSGSSFTITATDGLSHAYAVRQTDTAGNTSASVTRTYTLDTTAPIAPTVNLASDTGASPSDGITSNSTVNVTGIESGATWQYKVDTGAWTNGMGSSFTLNPDGAAHTYTVRQIDVAGNITESAPKVYTLDTGAPTITSGAAVNALAYDPTSTVVYTAAASGGAVTYSISGGADAALFNINTSTGAVTFKNRAQLYGDTGANGVYDFTVQARDAAGNSVAQAVAVTMDAPSVVDLGIVNPNTGLTYKFIAPQALPDGSVLYFGDADGNGVVTGGGEPTNDLFQLSTLANLFGLSSFSQVTDSNRTFTLSSGVRVQVMSNSDYAALVADKGRFGGGPGSNVNWSSSAVTATPDASRPGYHHSVSFDGVVNDSVWSASDTSGMGFFGFRLL